MINAILFFSWSVKSMSSKSGIEVMSSLVISISKKLVLSTIGGGIVVVVVEVVVVEVVVVWTTLAASSAVFWKVSLTYSTHSTALQFSSVSSTALVILTI